MDKTMFVLTGQGRGLAIEHQERSDGNVLGKREILKEMREIGGYGAPVYVKMGDAVETEEIFTKGSF